MSKDLEGTGRGSRNQASTGLAACYLLLLRLAAEKKGGINRRVDANEGDIVRGASVENDHRP